MKKLLVTFTLAMFVTVSSLFANSTEEVNQRVVSSFNKEFKMAKEVEWETAKDLYKATFKMNEQVMFAFFTKDGEMVAVSRNLSSSQLPIQLSASLKKSYNDFWITDLFELSSKNETGYYVTLENADQKLILKSYGLSGWEVYRKEKKEAI